MMLRLAPTLDDCNDDGGDGNGDDEIFDEYNDDGDADAYCGPHREDVYNSDRNIRREHKLRCVIIACTI